MSHAPAVLHCLTYCPMPYNGRGPANSCVQIIQHFGNTFHSNTLFVSKCRPNPKHLDIASGLPGPFAMLPWRFSKRIALASLNGRYLRALANCDKRRTVSYFWPSPQERVLTSTRDRGVLTFREMINSHRGTAKPILDAAFEKAGLKPAHTISSQSVDDERVELSTYDFVFSSNKEVDDSLLSIGVRPERILRTSFGWTESRFNRLKEVPKREKFTAIFVGTIGIRKGVFDLLRAWQRAGVDGTLYLIGEVEPYFESILTRFTSDPSIKIMPFTKELERLYKSSHIFIFPTYEEGGPQVTYEAAGCGLPAITSPMGAGRIIEHEINGLIVRPGDVDAIASAISRMSTDDMLLHTLSQRAWIDARRFTYDLVGLERATFMSDKLSKAS